MLSSPIHPGWRYFSARFFRGRARENLRSVCAGCHSDSTDGKPNLQLTAALAEERFPGSFTEIESGPF
jgi:hypothetical protein